MNSLRKQDMKAEKALGEFMDKSFYSKLHDLNGDPIEYRRATDYQIQMEGIDIVLETPQKSFFIDEKASLHYSNQMIPTFAFEVDSIQKNGGEPVEGWLLNDELKAEYYMLIWPNIKCEYKSNSWKRKELMSLTASDFTIVEAMLVKKDVIRSYLESLGFTKLKIREFAKKIRKNATEKSERYYLDDKKQAYFYYSPQLAERPINIVIRKEILRSLAISSYFISLDNYVKIMNDDRSRRNTSEFV